MEDRLSNLERQISVFERMVHMLSGSLDHRFKRYDMIICSQQQQISELNAVLSTFLNDEYRHAEVLREKLTGTLHGISATAASLGNTIHVNGRFDAENTNRSLDPDAIFGDILGDESPHTASRVSDKQDHTQRNGDSRPFDTPFDETNPQQQQQQVRHVRQHEETAPTANSNGSNTNQNDINAANTIAITNSRGDSNENGNGTGVEHDGEATMKSIPPEHDRQLGILSYGDFDHLSEAEKPTSHPVSNSDSQAHFYSDPRANSQHVRNSSNSNDSDHHPNGQSQVNSNDLGPDLKEEQYITNKGRKRKRSVYIGNFQFLKSPHSVMEVWKEYTEGINGQPSIREMETIYQTGWRRDPAVNKRYSRRKVLCKAIETGLARGYSLEYIVGLLEDYRYINREKGLKQPIGWICQGQNIPESLR